MHEILVVDSDPTMRQLFVEILGLREDCAVTIAARGTEALAAIVERTPRLIVLDCDLPDLHPLDLYAQLRLLPQGRTVPVLLIAGEPDALQTASLPGPHACLSKPFHLSDLDECVSALLGPARRRTGRRDFARRRIA